VSGSTTYALLAVPFLGVAVLVAVVAGLVAARRTGDPERARRRRRVTLVSAVVAGIALVVMTLVFNNVIVGLGVVAYDPAKTLGIRTGLFPVEDLAYSLGAVVLLPALWTLLGGPDAGRDRRDGAGTRDRRDRAGATTPRPAAASRPTRPTREGEPSA
jgi:lycopene cyclase domain-containing protein